MGWCGCWCESVLVGVWQRATTVASGPSTPSGWHRVLPVDRTRRLASPRPRAEAPPTKVLGIGYWSKHWASIQCKYSANTVQCPQPGKDGGEWFVSVGSCLLAWRRKHVNIISEKNRKKNFVMMKHTHRVKAKSKRTASRRAQVQRNQILRFESSMLMPAFRFREKRHSSGKIRPTTRRKRDEFRRSKKKKKLGRNFLTSQCRGLQLRREMCRQTRPPDRHRLLLNVFLISH